MGSMGSRTVNVEPWSSPGTRGHDLAVMLVDDPMSDREAKPRPLAVAALGEERLENVLEHVRAHSAAVVGEDHLGHAMVVARVDLERARCAHRLERVDDQIQTTCLISWASTYAITASRGWKMMFLPVYLPM